MTGTNPQQRLERLHRHACAGWRRVRDDPAERDLVVRWLAEHPSTWREVDELWEAALRGEGPLAAWLDAGADPRAWSHEIPLHSVLSSHPFACLTPWSTETKSRRS